MASQTYGPGLIDHFVGKLISSVDPTKKMAHCFPPYSMCHLFFFFQEAAIFSWNVAHSSCPPPLTAMILGSIAFPMCFWEKV